MLPNGKVNSVFIFRILKIVLIKFCCALFFSQGATVQHSLAQMLLSQVCCLLSLHRSIGVQWHTLSWTRKLVKHSRCHPHVLM
jgi:hypothetical protein